MSKREAEDPLAGESKKPREEAATADVEMSEAKPLASVPVKKEVKAAGGDAETDDEPIAASLKAKAEPVPKPKEEKKKVEPAKTEEKKASKKVAKKDEGAAEGGAAAKAPVKKEKKKKEEGSDSDQPIVNSLKKKSEEEKAAKKKTPKKKEGDAEEDADGKASKKKKKKIVASDTEGEEAKKEKKKEKKEKSAEKKEKKEKKEKPEKEKKEKKETEPKKKKAPKTEEGAEEKKPKKKRKSKAADEQEEEGGDDSEKKKKKKEPDPPEFIYDWWNHEADLPEGVRWRFFEHNGCSFPPEYKPHGVKMLYEGRPIDLDPHVEELATWYAGFANSDYLTKPRFLKNFWEAFSPLVRHLGVESLDKCDFQPIVNHFAAIREATKEKSAEEKKAIKAKKAEDEMPFSVVIMDGHLEPAGNFRIEPPGLFRGRGEHPKMGTVKPRIQPEEVSINISEDACPPICTVPGHAWKKVEHKDDSTWLCNIGAKYVFLAPSSSLKGMSDRQKFEVARKLKEHINHVREQYSQMIVRGEELGVVLWLIDNLALRVGNEKDTDEEADTVGACSLRVEHVSVDLSNPADPRFSLDFLGKDSIRYRNEIGKAQVRDHQHENLPLVCRCLQRFMQGKKPEDELFSGTDPSHVNSALKTLIEGMPISAKVFRTFNASITLVEELEKLCAIPDFHKLPVPKKLAAYNDANFAVAKLCNHSKAKAKNFDEVLEKQTKKIHELEEKRKELLEQKKEAKEDKDSIIKKIASLEEKIEKEKSTFQTREKLSEVALGTSKINYLDPRITVAFCKKVGLPIEKIFTKTLQKKFTWAMQEATEDWTF